MLTCREASERSQDLVDAGLPRTKRAELALHLLLCRHCRRYLRQLRAVAAVLRKMSAEGLSDASLQAQVEALRKF